MTNGIEGKVIVITGASSGIGQATAVLLAERGACVVLGARRGGRLEKIVEEIVGKGGQAVFAETDVTRRDGPEKLASLAAEKFGRLDVMVNNAGVAQLYAMEALDVAGWEETIDVNLKGTLYGIAAALPYFQKQSSGHFIDIISTISRTYTLRTALSIVPFFIGRGVVDDQPDFIIQFPGG